MVKVFKRNDGKTYYFRVKVNGKDIVESTGETSFNLATKKATERVNELRGKGNYQEHLKRLINCIDSLEITERENAINECSKYLLSGALVKMNFNNTLISFLEIPRSVMSKSTLNSYKRVWNNFLNWINDKYPEKQYLHEITDIIAKEYTAFVWKSGISEQTYNEHIKVLRSMFNALEKSAGLSGNVWKSVKKVKVESIGKEPITREQFFKLIENTHGEIRKLLLIGFYTGLRLGDACLLKWSEIKFKKNVIWKIPNKTRGTNKFLEIPLHEGLCEILIPEKNALPVNDNEYVLPETAKKYLKDAGAISRKIQKAFIDAGFKTTIERVRGVKKATVYGFHSLRHSFITICAEGGIPAHAVMDLVGHNSQEIHKIYQHTSIEQKQKAIDLFPKIGG